MNSNTKYPHIFEPIQIRGKQIRNRLEAAPISMGPVQKGEPLYEQVQAEIRAHSGGGVGLYGIGETFVSMEGNRREPPEFFDYRDLSDENLLPYKTAADIIKGNGCTVLAEISHCGARRIGHAFGPMAETLPNGTVVEAMDEAHIEQVCEDFADAAHYMEQAGFDGVLAHFGHGWLVHQFLSPLTNKRTDRFGGSIENRTRLAVMIIERIRQKTGPDFIVSLRMSGDELCDGGYDDREFAEFAKILDPYADIIQVSMGSYANPIASREFPSAYHAPGCNAYIAEQLKKVLKHAKVSVVGAVNDPVLAESIVASGKADFVAMGRQMFADAELPDKAKNGREEHIHPCLRCFCCFSGPLESASPDDTAWRPGCSVNPLHMRYEYLDMPVPDSLKTVLVAGGGIAGLSFAAAAQKRGHKVMLVERSGQLGGILNCVAPDPHKAQYIRYLHALEADAYEAGVQIMRNRQIDAAMVESVKPDVIVSAVGAHAAKPDISGIDGKNVISAVGAMGRLEEIGEHVVILGGGLIGCELAVFLSEQGRKVTIAARSGIIKNVYPMHGMALDMELNKQGVVRLPDHEPLWIDERGVQLCTRDGGERLALADTVIYALGLTPNAAAVEELRELAQDREFYAIGDCKSPRRIREATSEGFLLAMHLGTDYRPAPLKSLWL